MIQHNITTSHVRWAQIHDWYVSSHINSHGTWSVIVRNDLACLDRELEFTNIKLLKQWAGY